MGDALFDAGGRGAVLSEDGRFRYRLWRDLPGPHQVGYPAGTVLFIMLNPSTADADVDDPTIRRCVSFAKSWGAAKLEVGNLFALRATNPNWLLEDPNDAVGPENNAWLSRLALDADLIVCAWGAHKVVSQTGRGDIVRALLRRPLTALGTNADGSPLHPLYVPGDRRPQAWA